MLRMMIISLLVAAVGACSPSPEDSSDTDFFEGKNLSYIVATNAGGGYDAYARMIGTYLEDYLTIDHVVIRNVPGAGHIVGANTLWRAKPDGLTLGTFNAGLIYSQLVGNKAMRFDLSKFEPVGKAASDPRVVVVSETCEIKSMQDLIASEEPVTFASAGVGSASHTDAKLLAEAFDLNIEIITGYGGQAGEMAMLRGEVCAILGSASSFESFISSGYGSFIVAVGGKFAGVPNAMDFAETERAKRIVTLVDSVAQLGRITMAPPGTPEERMAVLRAAYKASLEDPELLAEAERSKRPIEPAYGDKMKQLILSALDQSPEDIEILAAAMQGE